MSKRNNFFGSKSGYTPRTIAFLTLIGVPNDGTVYFAATPQQITGAGIWTAVNNFDLGIIADGIDALLLALYLYIGGTATAHKYNFMNTSAFEMIWSGGITHNGVGVTGNGSNGYGLTQFTPNADGGAIYTQNSASFGFYTRTNEAGVYVDMGNHNAGTNSGSIAFRRRGGGNEFVGANNVETVAGNTVADIRKMYIVNRDNSATIEDYRDGILIASYARASTALIGVDYTALAYNANGTPIFHSPRNYALRYVGGGFTPTQITNFTNRVNTLQTALFRNV